MMNLKWNQFKNVEKENEFINEKGDEVLTYIKKNIESDLEMAKTHKGELKLVSRKGKFIYGEEGEIIQCLKDKTHVNYFGLKHKNYHTETTMVRMIDSKKNVFMTELISVGTSLLTKKEVYAKYDEKGNLIIDYNNKALETPKSQEFSNRYIKNGLVDAAKLCKERYSYGRRNYYHTSINFDAFKEEILEYLPEYFKEVEFEGSKPYESQVFYQKNKFYFNLKINTRKVYELPIYEQGKMKYTLIENVLYYTFDDNNVECQTINSEFSVRIKDFNVRLVNSEVIFDESIYSKYIRAYDEGEVNKVVLNDFIYQFNKDDFKYTDDNLTENLSVIKTTDEYLVGDDVIYLGSTFFIGRKGEVYIYDKKCSKNPSGVCETGYEDYTNIKFNRKKSDYYKYGNKLYSDNSSTHVEFDLTKYKETTLKLIYNGDYAYIKDKNNDEFIFAYDGVITQLKVAVDKISRIISLNTGIAIVCEITKENYLIQINNEVFEIKDEKLYHNDIELYNNVRLIEEKGIQLSKKTFLEKLTPVYYISIGADIYGYLNERFTFTRHGNIILVNVDNGKYMLSKNDNIYTSLTYNQFEQIKKQLESDKSLRLFEEKWNTINCKKVLKSILGGWTIDIYIINRILRNTTIYSKIVAEVESLKGITNKLQFETELMKKVISVLNVWLKEHGININEVIVSENMENIDFIDFVINIKNVKDHTEGNFESLLIEINNYLNNSNAKNEFILNLNKHNEEVYFEHGIDIEKFNSFDLKIDFAANSSKVFNEKNALQETLISQLMYLIGSVNKNQSGFLRVKNINEINYLYDKMFNSDTESLSELSIDCEKDILKVVNKLGHRIFKFLKSYQIKVDYINKEITINNEMFTDVPFKKLINMLDSFCNMLDKIKEEVSFISLGSELVSMINWSKQHIIDAYSNIDINNIEDKKAKNLTLKVWDRKDIFKNLAQGSRTHCCIALDSYNIGELVNYIFNKNIVLVEIKDDEKVVGQAFVYLATTEKKINYRYEIKKHVFMIIDNVEVNNKYQSYAIDIGKNLQRFMYEYMKHMDKVTDVFLGHSMNDIPAPYGFVQSMTLNVLGNSIYVDNDTTFHKFI